MFRLKSLLLYSLLLLSLVCQANSPGPTRRELLQRRDSIMRSRLTAIQKEISRETGSGAGPSRLPAWSSREGYDVGQIPYEEGVSPSGARTYTIPITTAQNVKLAPSLSLVYNSQSGPGYAGYGWDIGGLSFISIANKTRYYNGESVAARYDDTDAAWTLDGVPLVQNDDAAFSSYQYKTARGKIYIRKNADAMGLPSSFEALYPDGSSAVFQWPVGYQDGHTVFPMVMRQDREGNVITYEYSASSSNSPFLYAVNYGSKDESSLPCRIIFSYDHYRTDTWTVFYAGDNLRKAALLKGITSFNGTDTLARYSLVHQLSDRVNFLTEIRCGRNGHELPPLTFSYGPESGTGPIQLECSLNSILTSAFTDTTCAYVTKRGKFMLRGFGDGIVIHKWYENYKQKGSKFVSDYPSNAIILVAPQIGYYVDSVKTDFLTGEGFQTIDAVDADGDGVDELVKVNFGTVTGSQTRLDFTVYEPENTDGYSWATRSFSTYVTGVSSPLPNSPSRRTYLYGDCSGCGHDQLLTLTETGSGFYASLIDFKTDTRICDALIPSNIAPSSIDEAFLLDIDRDGISELCYAASDGLHVLSYRSTGTFAQDAVYSGVTNSVLYSTTNPAYWTDINGDGYPDLLSSPNVATSSYWTVRRFTGTGFNTTSLAACTRQANDKFFFLDLDKDGMTDMVKQSGSTLRAMLNINGESMDLQAVPTVTVDSGADLVPANVVSLFSSSHILLVRGPRVRCWSLDRDAQEIRALTAMDDSYGIRRVNEYQTMSPYFSRFASGVYSVDPDYEVNSDSSFVRLTSPLQLLSYSTIYGSAKYGSTWTGGSSFLWSDAVGHSGGLGFCGFRTVTRTDYNSGTDTPLTTETVSDPEKMGVPVSETVSIGSHLEPFRSVTNTWDDHRTQYGKLDPRLASSVQADSLSGVTTTTSYTYDSRDFPTQIAVTRQNNLGDTKGETTAMTYSHSFTPSKYILGSPVKQVITRTGDLPTTRGETELFSRIGRYVETWSRRTEWSYDSLYRKTAQREHAWKVVTVTKWYDVFNPPGPFNKDGNAQSDPQVYKPPTTTTTIGDGLQKETLYTYDSFGNVASEQVAGHGATTYLTTSYTWSSDGRNLVSKTDPLGRTVSWGGYDVFGNPSSSTDHKGRTTQYTYDTFGELVRTDYPDGTWKADSSAWGGEGLFTLTSTSSGSPATVTHVDAMGRTLRTEDQRFDGTWRKVDNRYDEPGRLSQTSLPYKGNSASLWNTTIYDKYGRDSVITAALGKTTLKQYSGPVTSVTDAGITSTTTVDADGAAVSVTDPGGTITYLLLPDGQPLTITAPGGVETNFAYDNWRDRGYIKDPSFGIHTDTNTWHTDGSMTTETENCYGTTLTETDIFGRVTSVVRQGAETLTFSYSTDGLPVSSVSSNGASTVTTYDAYDRPATVTDSASGGGPVLVRTFTYGSDGNLSSTAYSIDGVLVTTETYGYAYGHQVSDVITGSQTVWSLTSENALGLPTASVTLSTNRSYGYNSYGMPTSRSFGSLTETYAFSGSTGNLSSRSPAGAGMTQTYSYDSLHRLTSGTTGPSMTVSYDQYANITSLSTSGTMAYADTLAPYTLTSYVPGSSASARDAALDVTYTASGKPKTIMNSLYTATLSYGPGDDRDGMVVKTVSGGNTVATRRYLAGCYEQETTSSGTVRRLWLGGDAYSAPVVLVSTNGGTWTAMAVGRDYLGSVIAVANASGAVVERDAWDPWGRALNPSNLTQYSVGSEPTLALGRGFTGHEWLPWFSLWNANARIYDPLLGRFLSPDPYVQAPGFTQNFNRFAYALNNPLKYTDESGEYFWLIGALIGGFSNWIANGCKFTFKGFMYFNAGFGIGALSAGASTFTSTALGVSGVAAGSLVGASTGVLTGAATGFVSNGLNNLIAGNKFLDGAWTATRSGMISGALSGAVNGGLAGGKNALDNGKNVWWGGDVKYGRTQWSFFTSEKPYETIEFDLKKISYRTNDCVPASFTEINDHYGGKFSYDELSNRLSYKEGDGVEVFSERLRLTSTGYFSSSDFSLQQLSNLEYVQGLKESNSIISVYMKYSNAMNHMDNVRAIKFFSNKTVVQLRIGSYKLPKLIDKTYWALRINGLRY